MSKERELLQEVLNKSYFIKDTVMEGIFNRIEELLAQQEELTREPVSKCIEIINDRKEIAIENEWNVDEAMSSAVMDIMNYFNIGVDNE